MFEQLAQLQERILDQTEELQHCNAQLEVARRECVDLKAEYEDHVKLLIEERDHLQVCNKFSLTSLHIQMLLMRLHKKLVMFVTVEINFCSIWPKSV